MMAFRKGVGNGHRNDESWKSRFRLGQRKGPPWGESASKANTVIVMTAGRAPSTPQTSSHLIQLTTLQSSYLQKEKGCSAAIYKKEKGCLETSSNVPSFAL